MKRDKMIDAVLANNRFDVLIIGAGINGCALFRQLSLSSLRCLLIDRNDFSAGTSAASSRMAHGGLRYLEGGNFALVQESLAERNRLFRNASHLVRPVEVIIPYSTRVAGLVTAALNLLTNQKRSHRRGGLLVHIGLTLYDSFSSRSGTSLPHRRLGRKALDRLLSGLNEAIIGAGVYTDGLVLHPERLALELIQDGVRANPDCVALNYCEFSQNDQGIVIRPEHGPELLIAPRVVVNATGPSVDRVNSKLGLKTSHVMGSQGLHLVLDAPNLAKALGDRIVYFETEDGRLCLAYQLAGHVFTGTTDQLTGTPEGERDFTRDAAYILGNLNRLFPQANLRCKQITSSSFGVRAFAAVSAETAASVPRDHGVVQDTSKHGPVLSMVGGKWTTFRSFADDTSKVLTTHLPDLNPRDTRDIPIGGARDWPTVRGIRLNRLQQLGITAANAEILVSRYGSDDRIDSFLGSPEGKEEIQADPLLLGGELAMFFELEQARTLSDIFYRRWSPGFVKPPKETVIARIADIAAKHLRWDEPMRRRQQDALRTEMNIRLPRVGEMPN